MTQENTFSGRLSQLRNAEEDAVIGTANASNLKQAEIKKADEKWESGIQEREKILDSSAPIFTDILKEVQELYLLGKGEIQVKKESAGDPNIKCSLTWDILKVHDREWAGNEISIKRSFYREKGSAYSKIHVNTHHEENWHNEIDPIDPNFIDQIKERILTIIANKSYHWGSAPSQNSGMGSQFT